jgi:hypothetical protein
VRCWSNPGESGSRLPPGARHPPHRPNNVAGDRQFESISLQPRVTCEPDSSIKAPQGQQREAAPPLTLSPSRHPQPPRARGVAPVLAVCLFSAPIGFDADDLDRPVLGGCTNATRWEERSCRTALHFDPGPMRGSPAGMPAGVASGRRIISAKSGSTIHTMPAPYAMNCAACARATPTPGTTLSLAWYCLNFAFRRRA